MGLPNNIGFDEAGQRVEVVDFDFDAVDAGQSDVNEADAEGHAPSPETATELDRLRFVKNVLRMLQAQSQDAEEVGRRVMLFAHLLALDEPQAELARRLKMTPGRVSQIKRETANEFRHFTAVLVRSAKHPAIGEGNEP